MKRTVLFLIVMLCVPAIAWAQVYRCDESGETRFSDQPCGENSERVIIRDNQIGGSFGQNLPPESELEKDEQDEGKREQQQTKDTCRFINSTDLRRYLVREQVVKGMTREHVRKAFGRPPETYPTPQETWVYQTKYYGNLYELTYVYFRDGCVEDVIYRKP